MNGRQNASYKLAACHGKGQVDNQSTTSTGTFTISARASMFPKGLYLLAEHICLMTLSSVSKLPSFKALVRDMDPCSLWRTRVNRPKDSLESSNDASQNHAPKLNDKSAR